MSFHICNCVESTIYYGVRQPSEGEAHGGDNLGKDGRMFIDITAIQSISDKTCKTMWVLIKFFRNERLI